MHASGWRSARPSCCRCPTSTSSSRCRRRSRDIAYQNKAVVYDLLFEGGGRDDAHDRRRSEAPRRPHRHHRRAAHLGLGDDASSARAHDRAGRRHLSEDGDRWIVGAARLLPAGHVLSRLFRRLMLEKLIAAHAPALQFFGDHSRPRRAARFKPRSWRRSARANGSSTAKAPFAGPRAVLRYLSRYTHRVAISNRRLVADRRGWRHVPLEGLSRRGRRRAGRR